MFGEERGAKTKVSIEKNNVLWYTVENKGEQYGYAYKRCQGGCNFLLWKAEKSIIHARAWIPSMDEILFREISAMT